MARRPFPVGPGSRSRRRGSGVAGHVPLNDALLSPYNVSRFALGRCPHCLCACAQTITAADICYSRNVLQSAFASVYLWSAVCLLLSQGYSGYDAAVALYLGAPLAALAGMRLAASRADRAFTSDASSAWTTYGIELRARYALHMLLWGHPTQEKGAIGSYRSRAAAADVESGRTGSKDAAATEKSESIGGSLQDSTDSQDDSELMARAVRGLLSPDDIVAVSIIINTGCSLFRLSPMMHIIAARFFLCYASNKHLHTR